MTSGRQEANQIGEVGWMEERLVRQPNNLPPPLRLKNGFWPKTRHLSIIQEQFIEHGEICEEYVEDPLFNKQKCDRPSPSFSVG